MTTKGEIITGVTTGKGTPMTDKRRNNLWIHKWLGLAMAMTVLTGSNQAVHAQTYSDPTLKLARSIGAQIAKNSGHAEPELLAELDAFSQAETAMETVSGSSPAGEKVKVALRTLATTSPYPILRERAVHDLVTYAPKDSAEQKQALSQLIDIASAQIVTHDDAAAAQIAANVAMHFVPESSSEGRRLETAMRALVAANIPVWSDAAADDLSYYRAKPSPQPKPL